jgi:CRISPR-associated endonuclease/helicase Cas3
MNFDEFFKLATCYHQGPFDYQCRLACGERKGRVEAEWLDDGTDCRSQLINIPTGLGKTAAVVLAWLWNRVIHTDAAHRKAWPRRLVYCLPMRTLVEQTRNETQTWLVAHDLDWDGKSETRSSKVGVHILMGGEDDGEWDIYPEENAILIGTQDMLLSRALNRGYGMSRYRWPMHFGLLNNDCLWVMDETQLMGPGLWTSGQLDWMRHHRFSVIKPCVTWWMSATNSPAFLDTPDRRNEKIVLPPVIEVCDDKNALSRLNPSRPLSFWKDAAPQSKSKKKSAAAVDFSGALASAIRSEHTPGTLSLIVCNSVRAAQELYRALGGDNAILLTSRFRRRDRKVNIERLLAFEKQRKAAAKASGDDTLPDSAGLICVSTQVVEAGVDISARRLWTEAAPWPSVLQRLGRLNRDGHADGKAKAFVFVWPEEGKKGKGQSAGPYEAKDVEVSIRLLTKLAAVCESEPTLGASDAMAKLRVSSATEIDAALKPKFEDFPRADAVHGLFSTEPDVFGGFTDVSPWIRGADKNADVTVFWRDFDAKKGPGKTHTLSGPAFDAAEGCALAIHRFREFLGKSRALVWEELSEQWQSIWPSDVCPGMIVMLPRSAGGYSGQLGWTGQANDKLNTAEPPGRFSDTFEDDTASEQAGWVTIQTHLADTKSAAVRITDALQLDDTPRTAVVTAAEWHDIGKAHQIWQAALPTTSVTKNNFWAKAPFVFVLSGKESRDVRESTGQLITAAGIRASFYREEVRDGIPRQLWTVGEKIRDTRSRRLLSQITGQARGLEGWMRRFLPRSSWGKPCIRHEAASALAVWTQYFNGGDSWPGLTLFLIACHHGKVRTVLYARGEDGEDVCGVPKKPELLPWAGGMLMDFSCAAVGTNGEFSDDGLTFTPGSPGWTALVADLLGSWEQRAAELPPPLALRNASEPRLLGPFSLAYLESLICAADVNASKNPSDLRHV